MRNLDVLAAILLVVGGLNWGLVGLADFNLVDYIFSSMPTVEKTIYGLVGLAAVYQIIGLKGIRSRWNVK
jgi:uncharacterized membrane protein YuzA (DUF378 family)